MRKFTSIIWVIPISFLLIFYFYPFTEILFVSFGKSENSWWGILWGILNTPFQLNIIKFSFYQAILSTILTTIIGLPLAYIFSTFSFRGKKLLETIISIPFVLPTLVVATAFVVMIGPKGWLNLGLMHLLHLSSPPLNISHSLGGILIAHIFYNTSIVTRIVGDHWKRIDKNLKRAAQSLGANRWNIFWRITLPSIAPAVWAASLLTFLFNFTSFGVILILGGFNFSTIEVEIYYQTVGLFNLPLAGALSLLQLFFTTGIVFLYRSISEKLNNSQANQIEEEIELKNKSLIFKSTIIFFLSLSFLFFVLPILGLLIRSITINSNLTEGIFGNFSFLYYQALLSNTTDALFYVSPLKAMQTSLINAFLTILVSIGIGLPTAWLSSRANKKISPIMDTILMLPLGTSAITLGLGYILAFNKTNFSIITSPLIIPLAHSLIAIPFVYRSLVPSFASIQKEIKSAAQILGANTFQTWRFIEFPIVSRAILIAATFSFTISLGEFGASSLISRPEFPTIPIMIFRYLGKPGGLNYGMAIALSCILMIISGFGMYLIQKLNSNNMKIF